MHLEETPEHTIRLGDTIDIIEEERMTDHAQVTTNLMTLPPLDGALDEAAIRQLLDNTVHRPCLDHAIAAPRWEAPGDLPFPRGWATKGDAEVALLPPLETRCNNRTKYGPRACEKHDPRCLEIQTMNGVNAGKLFAKEIEKRKAVHPALASDDQFATEFGNSQKVLIFVDNALGVDRHTATIAGLCTNVP